MHVPDTIQLWMALRRRWEATGKCPRILPIVRIGHRWYFADDRLREYRNALDSTDARPW